MTTHKPYRMKSGNYAYRGKTIRRTWNTYNEKTGFRVKHRGDWHRFDTLRDAVAFVDTAKQAVR